MALSFCMLANWGFNYTTASWFPQMADGQMGKVIVYVALAISCVIAYMFTYRYIPETKDKTQDECVQMVMYARYYPVSGEGGDEDEEEEDEEEEIVP
jgi:hypothetical protein